LPERPGGCAAGSSAIDSPATSRLSRRFAADWTRLLPPGSRAGLAVSGGPDSLALLLLAHAAFPGTFEVASVDHGLRDGSAGEAKMVARLCAARGIAHRILAVSVPVRGNLQANARAARYEALAAWLHERGLPALATAHHSDDQAETLLMRLNRGAGVRGLAAMRECSPLPGAPDLLLLRPLLGWRREELRRIVAEAGIEPALDPSNRDARYARVRIREGLAGASWLDPAALSESAANLADADAALEWAAEREWSERIIAHPDGLAYDPAAPRAIRLRILARIAAQLGRSEPRGRELARWLDSLEQGGTATLAGVRGDGGDQPWRFVPAPPHRQG